MVTDSSRRLEATRSGYRWVDDGGASCQPRGWRSCSVCSGGFGLEEITDYGTQRLDPSVTVRITHAGGSPQEVRVGGKGRAVVTGRPVGYLLSSAQVAAISGLLAE